MWYGINLGQILKNISALSLLDDFLLNKLRIREDVLWMMKCKN